MLWRKSKTYLAIPLPLCLWGICRGMPKLLVGISVSRIESLILIITMMGSKSLVGSLNPSRLVLPVSFALTIIVKDTETEIVLNVFCVYFRSSFNGKMQGISSSVSNIQWSWQNPTAKRLRIQNLGACMLLHVGRWCNAQKIALPQINLNKVQGFQDWGMENHQGVNRLLVR